jgi:hypothetical protein
MRVLQTESYAGSENTFSGLNFFVARVPVTISMRIKLAEALGDYALMILLDKGPGDAPILRRQMTLVSSFSR